MTSKCIAIALHLDQLHSRWIEATRWRKEVRIRTSVLESRVSLCATPICLPFSPIEPILVRWVNYLQLSLESLRRLIWEWARVDRPTAVQAASCILLLLDPGTSFHPTSIQFSFDKQRCVWCRLTPKQAYSWMLNHRKWIMTASVNNSTISTRMHGLSLRSA